ncbi:hypothetical protein [Enterococcus gilvus]|uniref:hypothetical protein n=1 Tax=Enterococcus gilvus TaxID=160453 RepID=UPI00345E6444
MNVFKVSMRQVWGKWHDFTFVTVTDVKSAIRKALDEIDIPTSPNDKVTITVSLEGPAFKKRGKN